MVFIVLPEVNKLRLRLRQNRSNSGSGPPAPVHSTIVLFQHSYNKSKGVEAFTLYLKDAKFNFLTTSFAYFNNSIYFIMLEKEHHIDPKEIFQIQ